METNAFSSELINSNRKQFKYTWTWQKHNGTVFLNTKKQPLRILEDVLIFYRKSCTYNPQMEQGEPYTWNSPRGHSQNYNPNSKNETINNSGTRYPKNLIKCQSERSLHPTQKPVALFEYLIKTYTNKNEVVLDSCIGSGTTAIACLNTNRQYIGFETNPDYFAVANQRIKNHKIVQKPDKNHTET